MQAGHIQTLDKSIGLLKKFLGFASCTCYHIHTYKGVRHHLLYLLHFVGKECRIVVATHQRKHLVAACQKRNVKMRHKCSPRCHKIYHLIA